uniref:Serpentine receptor class gamma n=1 Tax=Panagrolaimus davidi TaxID=227884 RepID=A0A914RE06_9BILA
MLSFNDLMAIASKCEILHLSCTVILNNDAVVPETEEDEFYFEAAVSLETLLKALPNVKSFEYYLPYNSFNIFTTKSAEELLKIPHFLSLDKFGICEIPDFFDINSFYNHIKIKRIPLMFNAADILSFIVMTISFKWPLSPLIGPYFKLLTGSYILVIANFFQVYFNIAHSLLVTLTSFNRMTSMALPRLHEKLWKQILWPGILVSLVLSIVPIWHLPFSTISVIPFNAKVSEDAYVMSAKYPGVSTAFNQAITFFVIAVVGLLLNILCNGFLLKIKALTTQKRISRTEIRLVFVSLFDFILEILFCVHQISIYLIMVPKEKNWDLFDTLFLQIPWLFDLINLSRPFLLLLMSQQVRTCFFNLFRSQNVRIIEPTAAAPTNITKTVQINPSTTNNRR